MFKTKKAVDKHVSDILSKLQNENERNQKGLVFARLYYDVKDYEMAKRYLAGYLSVSDNLAMPHKLMGQIMEALGNKESALQSYKRSLDIDVHQRDLVLKICELYCDLPVDPDTARYWADRAEKIFSHHEVILRLRECIVNAEGEPDTKELEQLITSELKARPKDVTLYTKLLKLYTDTERLEEAYRYAAEVETRKPFKYSIDWYYCLADIFEAYQEEKVPVQLQFCLEYLVVLDHLCSLLLSEPHALSDQDSGPTKHSRSVADAASILHTFDKFLLKCNQQASFGQDPSWKYIKSQMQGQLYLHLATLLTKRAKKERANWKEAFRYASALYLVAYTFKPGSLQQETWFCKMETNKQIFLDVQKKGFLRLSYAGHILTSLCSKQEERPRWLQKVKQETCVQQAQEKIFQRAFSSVPASRGQQHLSRHSFFIQDTTFVKVGLEFPTEVSLHEYDKVSYKVYPNSLHHLAWLSLHWLTEKQLMKQPEFQIFEKLQLSNALLNSGAPESFCQLDVDAFLCATIFCAWGALEERGRIKMPSKGLSAQTMILSVTPDICDPLCTLEQASWWKAAYALHFSEAKNNSRDMRQTLTRGLETIRGVGAHGMDVVLLVHLARHFSKRADALRQSLGDGAPSEEMCVLADRATHYWNLVLNALDKLQGGNGNQNSSTPSRSRTPTIRKFQPLFPSFHPEPSVREAVALMEEARFYLACRLMDSGQLSEAAQAFSKLTSVEASHNHATVLVKLSQQAGQDEYARAGLLGRAREALYVTLDRISGNKEHSINVHLHQEIEAVEQKLAQIENNGAQPDKGSEDSSPEDEDAGPDLFLNGTSPLNNSTASSRVRSNSNAMTDSLSLGAPSLNLNGSLFDSSLAGNTSRPRLRPSPERLDAQIRALSYNQVGVLQLLLEQQRTLMESVKSIVEELRQHKNLVEGLKTTVEELKSTRCIHSQQQTAPKPFSGQPLRRTMSQRTRSMASQPDDENDNEAYEESGHPDPGQLYDYALDPEAAGFDYNSYLHDPRNPTNMGYPMMMHYPPHYPQPPHMAPPMPPSLTPQPLLNQRPPRSCYPPCGTALTFSEGQQLPQFNFRMPPPSPALSVQGINAIDNRTSVFARLGPPPPPSHGPMVPPPPPPPPQAMWENQQLPPQLAMSPQEMQWSNKGNSGAPHAFQIPLPSANFPSSQPPSILSSSHATGAPTSETEGQKETTSVYPSPLPGFPKSTPETFQGFSTPGNVSSTSGGLPATPSSGQKEQGSDMDDVEIDFKPAIPLPDEVDVCTGEEHENVLFEERAKLFRFVEKEWKERGVGVLKLLLNKNTGKIRLLMRRDQVLKVCANHHILSTMSLQPMKDSDRAWIWAAQDFAEETIKNEQFCIRFKNKDLALGFKKAFEAAVEKDRQRASTPKVTQIDGAATKAQQKAEGAATKEGDIETAKPFGDKFKPPPGSWRCSTCLIVNKEQDTKCVVCETPKSGTEAKSSTPNHSGVSPFLIGGSSGGSGFAGLFQSKSTKCVKCKDATVNTEGELCASCKSSSADRPQAESGKNAFGGFVVASKFQTDGQKNEFGGFTFTSTPVIKPSGEASKEKPAVKQDRPTVTAVSKQKESPAGSEKTQSPFASFQFVAKPGGDVKGAGFPTTPVTSKDKKNEPTVLFGHLSNTASLTFGHISSTGSTGFKMDPNFKGFPGSGQQLFSSPDASSPKDGPKEGTDDFVPSAEFQPVVPLPELITIKTGEEDEEKMFVERAKLFRYVSETKEWKERGIGDVKILKNPKTFSCRVLMRRDQVLKICANHRILPEMTLTPMSSSDKAWVWFAHDYSEGELAKEKFAIKFKNKEIALKFKKAFEECQQLPCVTSAGTDYNVGPSTLERFKPKPGSWECPGCLTRQDEATTICPACDTAKPNSGPKQDTTRPLSELFKPEEGSWKCDTCEVRNKAADNSCVACTTPRTKSTSSSGSLPSFSFVAAAASKPHATQSFTFGVPITSTDTQSSSSPFNIPNFTFVDKNSSPSFKPPSFNVGSSDESTESSMQSSKSVDSKFGSLSLGESAMSETVSSISQLPGHTTPPPSADGFEFKFGSPQKFEFHFSGVRPRSPSKAPKSPGTPSDSAKDGAEDEADVSDGEIFFQPVVPLPAKVDVKTGEEGEKVLYCHRAKLFRLDNGEWKERGTGDVKILKDLKTKKIRLLMRREQVLKVCMNHLLPVDLELKEKGDRTWFWSAVDYAEGNPQPEQLALRFKNHDVAQGFKNAVENAKNFLKPVSTSPKQEKPEVKKSEDQDVPTSEATPASTEQPSTPKKIQDSVFSANDGKASSVFGQPAHPPTTTASFVFGNAGNLQTQSPSAPGTFVFGGSSLTGSGAGSPATATPSPATPKITSGEDVQVLEEKKSSEEKQNLALSLKLPANFFRYEEKAPCRGCRGCSQHQHGNKETDVQLLFVDEASEEEKAKAKRLMLPESFYLYRKKVPCPGCRGCMDDEESPKQSPEKEFAPVQLDPYVASGMEPPSASQQSSETSTTTPTTTTTVPTTLMPDTGSSIAPVESTPTTTSSTSPTTLTVKSATPTKELSGTTLIKESAFGSSITPTISTLVSSATTSTNESMMVNSATPIKESTFASLVNPTTNATTPTTVSTMTSSAGPTAVSAVASCTPVSTVASSPSSTSPTITTTSGGGSPFLSSSIPEFSFAKVAAESDVSGFAALAAQAANPSAFKTTGTGFVGAGMPVFGKPASPKKDETEEVAPSVDVHFDPLVPLPELVEVKTGEEEEVSIFSQRARLYRFDSDSKQWKERGVGEIKILKHNARCQFRLLLRRDQVLKIACNHLISPTMELSPMATNNNSLIWSALDFSEGVQSAETFCIRFKNGDILGDFKKAVEDCKAALNLQESEEQIQENVPEDAHKLESSDHEDEYQAEEEDDDDEHEEQPEWAINEELVPGDEDLYYKASEEYEERRHQEHSLEQEETSIPDMNTLSIGEQDGEDPDNLYHSEEVDEEDEEEDEEDDCEQLFEKRISLAEAPLGSRDYKPLGMGTLRVLYDDEVYGGRIQVADDSNKLLCDHIVAVQTCLRVVDKEATWSVIDMALPEPARRHFKAVFSSLEAAQEFQKVFDEAKSFAVTSEIVENEDPAPNFS